MKGQYTFELYWKEGASDRQNQQSFLSSLSFQELNPLYNNQWSTQVPYLFYDQNGTLLANNILINSFIEPSYSYYIIQNQLHSQLMLGLDHKKLQLINVSQYEITIKSQI
ncbi:hypothetical protein F8M41_023454 [Gigaspora margarita]|uniref:Uncharacterized protein n=1 Tax=Gigaspora margarita TaxID=4874 RepID=A0A8H4ADD0_GIGMA|nr:hypothetical protein F8M41_023454 [Gigaspora margarita]